MSDKQTVAEQMQWLMDSATKLSGADDNGQLVYVAFGMLRGWIKKIEEEKGDARQEYYYQALRDRDERE